MSISPSVAEAKEMKCALWPDLDYVLPSDSEDLGCPVHMAKKR
jgi:hypothetical protein